MTDKIKVLGIKYEQLYVEKAIMFFKHLEEHPEVQNAPISKGIPMCKICGKDANKIHGESYHIKRVKT